MIPEETKNDTGNGTGTGTVTTTNPNANEILTELKAEDLEKEYEKTNLIFYEDRLYNTNFLQLFLPDFGGKVNEKGECFSLRFSQTAEHIAAGYSNGCVNIFPIAHPSKAPVTIRVGEYPVTCVRWKPAEGLLKNILLSVTADGKIGQWHSTSGKPLSQLEEKDNAIMCVDYTYDGRMFATGGNDKLIRVYDDNTKTLITTMTQTSFTEPGHSNRIFCVNFHKENLNLLVSGGWDNTVQFYDLRESSIVSSFYGPHICGDAMDMKGDYLLTGSWTTEDQIQIWDIRMLKLVQNVSWEEDKTYNPTYIYSAQYNKGNKCNVLGVGGSNNNIFRIFEDETTEKKPQCTTKYLRSPCFTLDFSNNGDQFAFGCGDGIIRLLSIESGVK